MRIRAGKAWTRAQRRFTSCWTQTGGEDGAWGTTGEKRFGREGPEPEEVLRREGGSRSGIGAARRNCLGGKGFDLFQD